MLSAPAVAFLLLLHNAAVRHRPGPAGSFPRGDDITAAEELVSSGLAYRHRNGRVFITAAGVDQARRMKGETPIPLSELILT
jgi:hypothetical protein